jgi:hypothetical protein
VAHSAARGGVVSGFLPKSPNDANNINGDAVHFALFYEKFGWCKPNFDCTTLREFDVCGLRQVVGYILPACLRLSDFGTFEEKSSKQ